MCTLFEEVTERLQGGGTQGIGPLRKPAHYLPLVRPNIEDDMGIIWRQEQYRWSHNPYKSLQRRCRMSTTLRQSEGQSAAETNTLFASRLPAILRQWWPRVNDHKVDENLPLTTSSEFLRLATSLRLVLAKLEAKRTADEVSSCMHRVRRSYWKPTILRQWGDQSAVETSALRWTYEPYTLSTTLLKADNLEADRRSVTTMTRQSGDPSAVETSALVATRLPAMLGLLGAPIGDKHTIDDRVNRIHRIQRRY